MKRKTNSNETEISKVYMAKTITKKRKKKLKMVLL